MARVELYKERTSQLAVNPTRFTLWLFLITVTMLFAAFTSALIVSRTDAIQNGSWISYSIPNIFTFSTVVIALSSLSMQWAYYNAGKNEIDKNRLALWITFILGMVFLVAQVLGYKALTANGIHLTGDSTVVNGHSVAAKNGAFFYVISGIHALHVVGGVFILLFTLISAYRFRVHSRNMLRINLCTTYWHFIGVLWVYLFAILNIFS
ncbi:MAG: cytochrome c oxidase subunit 3 [Bacteroidota bacterium]|nr:cytochrome c oxidase subunit 3 [Bacteroidota bacterium]